VVPGPPDVFSRCSRAPEYIICIYISRWYKLAGMDALDLFQLGRWLTRLGEEAMRPLDAPTSPPGQRLILMDAFACPDSSVGEIATRTGLPQSYVSAVVSRLREAGAFKTRTDPGDRRRTLVRVSDSLPPTVAGLGRTPVDTLLTEALGELPPKRAVELIAALSEVADRLRTRLAGPGTPDDRLRQAGRAARPALPLAEQPTTGPSC
jgi:DNA-binding MarR family transcriptional regulator